MFINFSNFNKVATDRNFLALFSEQYRAWDGVARGQPAEAKGTGGMRISFQEEGAVKQGQHGKFGKFVDISARFARGNSNTQSVDRITSQWMEYWIN